MSKTGQMARERLARQLREAIEAIDAGNLSVSGVGHSAARTKQRLQRRLRELEAKGAK
jgi:hypothetical protein